MLNSLFTATKTLQIKYVGLPKWLVKQLLFSHPSLKAQHSASTFLHFVNIARLLKQLDKSMLSYYY